MFEWRIFVRYPSIEPTSNPTKYPTSQTKEPTTDPTLEPSTDPTDPPTLEPTLLPTESTLSPSVDPTSIPTLAPTGAPFESNNADPITTADPTSSPTLSVNDSNSASNNENGLGFELLMGIVFGALFFITLVVLMAYCVYTSKKQNTVMITSNATLKNAPDSIQFLPDLPEFQRGITAGGPEGGETQLTRMTSEGHATMTGFVGSPSSDMYAQPGQLDKQTSMGPLQLASEEVEEKETEIINFDTDEDDDEDIHQMYDKRKSTANGLDASETAK